MEIIVILIRKFILDDKNIGHNSLITLDIDANLVMYAATASHESMDW